MATFVLVYATSDAPLLQVTAAGAHVDTHLPGLQTMFVSCTPETAERLETIEGIERVRAHTRRRGVVLPPARSPGADGTTKPPVTPLPEDRPRLR